MALADQMRSLLFRPLFALGVGLLVCWVPAAQAQDAAAEQTEEKTPVVETRTFMGNEVVPMDALMVVTADVNVRDEPDTSGKKLGLLQVGERVEVVGDAEGTWYAVQQDGKDLGFVYAPVLKQVMNVVIEDDLRGTFSGPGDEPCEYIIRFERLGSTTSETYQAADYEVGWRCKFDGRGGGWTTTIGFLFMPEAPVHKRPPTYQISVDLLHMTDTVEDPVTVTYLYRPDSGELIFDQIQPEAYGSAPDEEVTTVVNLAQALRHTVAAAAGLWNDKVWLKIRDGG